MNKTTLKPLLLLTLPLALPGCISISGIEPVRSPERLFVIKEAPSEFEQGRQAILAMIGDYQVTFSFEETEAVQPGYELEPSKESDAYELVLLAEDSETRIVLQHLLVHRAGGFVVKHWRQDWHYEATERLEFTEDQTWRVRAIAPEVTRGAWTQCVYEVSDAPRYCGTGKWVIADGVPTWTSDAGFRPLPRREYSKRDDYNALGIVNSHSITMDGWTHGQQNDKVVRDGEAITATLVREEGLNTYRRIIGYNFSSGYEYWEDTKDYWARIRGEWYGRIAQGEGIHLKYPVDGMKMIMNMYWQSERARKGKAVSDEEIRTLFDPWVEAPAVRQAGHAGHADGQG